MILDAIFENLPHMIFVKDAERLAFVEINRFGETLLGMSRADLIGKTDYDFFPPEQAAHFQQNDRETLAKRVVLDIPEERIETRNGPRWLHTKKVPIFDASGAPAFLLGISEDITERKRTEAENATWSHIFEHADWGVAVHNAADNTLERLNPAFAQMHGFTVEELLGKPIGMLFAPEGRARLPEYLKVCHEQGHVTFESTKVRKDGSVFPVLIAMTALRDTDGSVRFRAANTQDISVLKQALEDSRKATLVAQNTSRELEAFSYSVSHDLRAPLRGIDGFSRILLESHASQLDERGRHFLDRVRAAAQRMSVLIDDLLELSRVTRTEPRRQLVDLTALIDKVVTELRERDPARVVEVVVARDLRTDADPALMQVLFDNLLGNAWKFTSRKASAKIEVDARPVAGGLIEVFVRDDGAGFDPAYSGKLFGAFQRLHTQSEFEGVGVGLATVQRIVHRHGGTIRAEGQVDHGATFYLTLPALK